ncbi:MAG: COG3014 family protein [Bacteroidia bacterium]
MKFSGLQYALVLFIVVFSGCSSYYQKNSKMMNAVYKGNFSLAAQILKDDKKMQKPARNRLLFYLNKGTVLFLNNNFSESINYFRHADYFVEDYHKNVGNEALALISNPNITTYAGESFEQVMIHYYGALNYLMINDKESALIETKRMLSKMQRITDKYKNNNKYKVDAFAHLLAGIVYDANNDPNNAFIAYRNAYKIYKDDYSKKFNTDVPEQLKIDIIRTAYQTGFNDEVAFYEKEFNIKFNPSSLSNKTNAVVFWNNGFGPIKTQKSINFTVIPYANHPGWVEFTNWDLGISIPIKLDDDNQRKSLLDLKIIRMALPQYQTRNPVYQSATIKVNNQNYQFQLAQNVNAIAYKSLEDRELAELSKGIMRVALKQLLAHQLKQQNQGSGLGLAAQIYGAVSEQADTRNWQLLPHSIFYTRIPLHEGSQKLEFTATGSGGAKRNFTTEIKPIKGNTSFVIFNTLEFSGYSNNR